MSAPANSNADLAARVAILASENRELKERHEARAEAIEIAGAHVRAFKLALAESVRESRALRKEIIRLEALNGELQGAASEREAEDRASEMEIAELQSQLMVGFTEAETRLVGSPGLVVASVPVGPEPQEAASAAKDAAADGPTPATATAQTPVAARLTGPAAHNTDSQTPGSN